MTPATLQLLHVLASLVVLAEALNKLERTAPLARGLTPHQRVVDGLKAAAWALLALGAAGGVASPVLLWLGVPSLALADLARPERPTLAETAVMAGFAVLIIRTRVKEG